MTDREIRISICTIMQTEAKKGLNEIGAAHYEGVLRGLIWAMNGSDPGRLRLYSGADLKSMFDAAGIPSELEDGVCRFDLGDEYIPEELRDK